MKTVRWLTLISCVAASVVSVCAQERTVTITSISALAREAGRLAVTDPRPRPQTPAQSADDTAWSRVQRLSAGEEVRVVRANDTALPGAFRLADAGSITLFVAGHEQKTARADVRQVLIVRDTYRWQHVLLGLAIGGVAGGIAVGLHCRGASASCKEAAPAYVAPGVGVGAAIGALLPPRKTWQEIYVR
jgi:hypothetical protein